MSSYRILVADELSAEGMQLLNQAGEVVVKKGMDEATLRDTLPPFHALVVRSATKVTARSLDLAENLAVIGRAGIGIDNVDLEAATERGIVVMNTPEAGAVTTGEHALALLMSLARRIPAADSSMKQGRWEKSGLTGSEISGKTFGIIGLGRIGRVVAERGKGLCMKVVAYDPYVSEEQAPIGVQLMDLDDLLGCSDFVTVHVPLSDQTQHLLNAQRLQSMKPGAYLIHAARGGIVDESALCDVLESGHLAGAALDVYEEEPLGEAHPLRKFPNVVLTPHLGASTAEAKRNVSLDMAKQIITCLKRGITLNGVNVPRIAPSEAMQVEPYLTLARNLTAFLAQIHEGKVESLRLTLQGSRPESCAEPLTVAMQVGAMQNRADIPVTPVNATRIAENMGVRIHTESSTLKKDFLNLIRVEAVIDGVRHFVSGTVLGNRHVRMVEFDEFMLDAIPEGSLLVTFHRDRPGVAGRIGTVLGENDINVERLQLGARTKGEGSAIAIWNLAGTLTRETLKVLQQVDGIEQAHRVRL